LIYSAANRVLSQYGAKHRKRSSQQGQKDASESGGAAIALGALLDGIPESMAIGLTMLAGGSVSMVTVIAIFISNIPEGLSSSAGMKASGRSASFIFCLWSVITLASAIAAIAGATLLAHVPVSVQSAVTALAAGAILSMLSETMMPEAYEGTHDWAGIITCAGFLSAFLLTMLEG
jgi:ZIP family zinc transporter